MSKKQGKSNENYATREGKRVSHGKPYGNTGRPGKQRFKFDTEMMAKLCKDLETELGMVPGHIEFLSEVPMNITLPFEPVINPPPPGLRMRFGGMSKARLTAHLFLDTMIDILTWPARW